MKKKNIIASLVFIACISYLGYCAVSNLCSYSCEEDRIFSSISSEDAQVDEMLLMKEKQDGVFCLATSKQERPTLMLASLKKDGIISRILYTGYESNVIYVNPEKVMSNSINNMEPLNKSKARKPSANFPSYHPKILVNTQSIACVF